MRRQGSAAVALSVPVVFTAAAQAAAAAGDERPAVGLPFSIADLGWVTLAVAALIVLASVLQAIARRRRRRPVAAVAPGRTDP